MKKFFYAIAAMSLLVTAASCNKDKGGLNLDDVVLDGFYVYGDATGSDKVESKNSMAAGSNEVDKTARSGMFEKYIYLQGGKDFALIENQAGKKVFYGAELTEVNYGYDENDPNCKNFADNPNMMILQGQLIIGETAPKMQVKETGLYHIVLDNNQNGDLAQGAQIIVHKADFGIRGGCNGWGFDAGEQTVGNDGTITFTWNDVEFAASGEFKFASCHGWKINLDEDGIVKAEISLGVKDGKLSNTGDNIVAGEKAGLYKLVLNYKPSAGAVADSFSYSVTLTQESDIPTECYMTGTDFGNWTWGAEGVVSLIPAHSEPGVFWTVRYIADATHGFKLSTKNVAGDWSAAFGKLTTNEGFTNDADGNCTVSEAGIYMIEVDLKNSVLNIHKAEVFGCAEPFDNPSWGAIDAAKYTANEDGTMSYTLKADGTHLRSFVKSAFDPEVKNWWHREFTLGNDGKIAYRGAGGDSATTDGVVAGKTVTLDFNAGTGSIK